MKRSFALPAPVSRLLACLGGSLVLAMMVGKQQGTPSDYGLAFREAILRPRVFIFLALGVLLFLGITYRNVVMPYAARPGVRPLAIGALVLAASFFLMKWYDAVGNGKFATLASQVVATPSLNPLTRAYFGWAWWVSLLVLVAVVAVAIVRHLPAAGWLAAVLSVLSAALAFTAHASVVSFVGAIDHSFGADTAVIGYLIIGGAGVVSAVSHQTTARTREFIDQVMSYRPGLPLVVLGLVLGVIAFFSATWFAPATFNDTLLDMRHRFYGTALAPLAVQYLAWMGYALLAVVTVCGSLATWLRNRLLGWITALAAVVGVILTLYTLYMASSLAAQQNVGGATGPWQNLGTGGWVACIGLFSIGAGGLLAATAGHSTSAAGESPRSSDQPPGRLHDASRSTSMRSLMLFGVALALFYPPTATPFWQKALVTDIGVYVLLAIGLNVVVGWAGLLDLGFIAFYALGSYTTAYLTGSLPILPPSWLQLSPLWAMPFAIGVCLIAGVLLGFPTLRLRGDYLAIVTLGFGEIIRIVANNNPGNFTNGPRGVARAVPNPVINLGFVKITWGQNQLQYWYLLLVLLVVVVVLFYRLEGSRLGRAWAAIREDEVAAQATGVNTTRVKLLAFAIGASTSGLAGVFFASQIGYFNPQNFILNNSILIVAYVVFGGMGSLPGAIAGAAALTWLPDFLRDQVPAEDRTMWIGAVVLLMMVFRPQGLLPARRRKAELSGLAGLSGAPSHETRAVPAGEGM